jgi:hypothetical protein
VCLLKNVEQLRNIGIINSTTRSHLVVYFYKIFYYDARIHEHLRCLQSDTVVLSGLLCELRNAYEILLKKTMKKEEPSKTQMFYGVILKRLLNQQAGSICAIFILIEIITSGGLLCTRKLNLKLYKTQGRNVSDLRRSVVHGVIFPAVIF